MRAPKAKPSSTPDLIAEHPAIRRILATQRAWIDGGRVLAYRTAIELDIAKQHPDEARRHTAQQWCGLVTPVLKAAWTAQAFHGGSECLQVFGGHGYVREWGIEQIVRDARVSMIYEGTNEIQAIDLLLRKVLPDAGAGLSSLLQALCEGLDEAVVPQAQFLRQIAALRQLTGALAASALSNVELPYWVADDYLRALALTLLAWAWLQIDAAPPPRMTSSDPARWREPAAALAHWVLPEFDMRLAIMRARLAGLNAA